MGEMRYDLGAVGLGLLRKVGWNFLRQVLRGLVVLWFCAWVAWTGALRRMEWRFFFFGLSFLCSTFLLSVRRF